jgi:hypothetical protein
VNTPGVIAANSTAGESATWPTQTTTVTDPPTSTSLGVDWWGTFAHTALTDPPTAFTSALITPLMEAILGHALKMSNGIAPVRQSIEAILGSIDDPSLGKANPGDPIGDTTNAGGSPFTVRGDDRLEGFGPLLGALNFEAGGAGALPINTSTLLSGQLAGFGNHDPIDWSGIGFGAAAALANSAARDSTASTLGVRDGIHSAAVALLGQYIAGNFALSSDGNGGTLPTDPPLPQQLLTQSHA